MDVDALSYGTCGSLIANLLIFAVMENVSEPPPWPVYGLISEKPAATYTLEPLHGWQSFIVDPGWGVSRRSTCPEPHTNQLGGPVAKAPLPEGYDPYAPVEEPFSACLLIRGDGKILSVKLLGSSGSVRIDGQILALITTRWRVEPRDESNAPAWHRVRLDAGPDEGVVYDAPQLD